MPRYNIVDTIIPDNMGYMQQFSYIHVDDDSFGVIDSLGFPILPYLPINISVPKNATDYQLTINVLETTNLSISDYILPSQPYISKDSNNYSFAMDTNFYTSDRIFHRLYANIEDEYIMFGEKGLTISLIPFEYNPGTGNLRIIKSANIEIEYDIVDGNTYGRRYTKSTENYLNKYFCNYTENRNNLNSDNYLIITHPDFFDAVKYFANYKRNIGFNVNIVSTNDIGNNSSSIKSYIQNMYNNLNTRPEYILLVGDVEKIPSFIEYIENESNLYTDIHYSLLDGNDLKADAFIGRFPVSNLYELRNVINKTIYMEMNLPYKSRKASLIAGYEYDWLTEHYFELGHNYAVRNAFKANHYECTKLYQPTKIDVSNSISDNPVFLIYSGHGSSSSWSLNQYIEINEIDMMNYENEIFPFTFSFACYTGNYNVNDCIGEKWLLSNSKGAVTYFGSSIATCCHPDYLIEKKIFDNISFNNISISSLINIGKNNYHDHFFGILNKRMKKYLKSYNLFGDPSIIINGIDYIHDLIFYHDEMLNFNEYSEYYSLYTISNNADLVLNDGTKLYLHAGREIILSDGFLAYEGSDFLAEITTTNSSRGDNSNNLRDNDKQENIYTEYQETIETTTTCEDSLSSINIYPNPTKDVLNISFSNNEENIRQIQIVNTMGTIMLDKANLTNNVIDINSISSGLYIVKIITNKGNVYFEKVVIEH